jgi:DNA-binding transcriptional regulator YiaG
MSNSSSLKELLARLGPVRGIERVSSGSPVALTLTLGGKLAELKTVSAALTLAKRHLPMLRGKRAMEALLETGRAYVLVPVVEDVAALVADLAAHGVAAAVLPDGPADVRAIRKQLGLTQEQFALRFGLDVAALRNWEAGRREPDTATRSYLRVIQRAPAQVEDALWAG